MALYVCLAFLDDTWMKYHFLQDHYILFRLLKRKEMFLFSTINWLSYNRVKVGSSLQEVFSSTQKKYATFLGLWMLCLENFPRFVGPEPRNRHGQIKNQIWFEIRFSILNLTTISTFNNFTAARFGVCILFKYLSLGHIITHVQEHYLQLQTQISMVISFQICGHIPDDSSWRHII